MLQLAVVLLSITGLVSLGCWIMTIIKAFQNNDTTAGIFSICPLVGFILGWINASKWNHGTIMLVWTVCIVISIVIQVAFPGAVPGR
jgi:hypothetical protein